MSQVIRADESKGRFGKDRDLPGSCSARVNINKRAIEVDHVGLYTSIRTLILHSIFECCHLEGYRSSFLGNQCK